MNKLLRQLLVFATFTISMMIYMRASLDELSENESQVNQGTVAYLALLAFFAGICESIEVYDHLFPNNPLNRQPNEEQESSAKSLVPSKSTNRPLLVGAGMAIVTPPLALSALAHKLQGDELALSLGFENEFWGLIFATPALVKFCAVAIPHLLHTLNGTRERYSLSVTNNKVTQLPDNSAPSLKWWAMLTVLVYLHMPEGDLIAAPIRNDLLKHLAAFGFALAESVPHLN